MKKKVLISACLLGVDCRYDGKNNRLPEEKLRMLMDSFELIPVCPECMGGLTTPRVPSERRDGGVYSKNGRNVTAEFGRGAEAALHLARLFGADSAILKENSPSCGSGRIYDGSFTGTLTEGDGVTAELLKRNGITVTGEKSI